MSDDKEKKEPISPEEEKGEENREEIPVEGLDISHKGPADSGDITDSIPDELPVIFIRDLTVFPYMALPLHVGREKSKKSVDKALHGNRMVLLLTQKDAKVEEPVEKDIYRVGTVVLILRMLKLSSGDVRLFVQGILRARVKELDLEGANPLAKIELIRDVEPSEETLELQALKKNLKQTFEKFIELGKQLPPELIYYIQEIEEAGRLADNILAYLTPHGFGGPEHPGVGRTGGPASEGLRAPPQRGAVAPGAEGDLHEGQGGDRFPAEGILPPPADEGHPGAVG